MKYACLVYLEADKLHAVPDRECLDCGNAFRERGVMLVARRCGPCQLRPPCASATASSP